MKVQGFSVTLILLIRLTAPSTRDDAWSVKAPAEVRAIEGYPAVLPCLFSHPHKTLHSSMIVVWRLGHEKTGTVLFRCSSLNGSQQCQTEPDQDQRYRLEGNHREHDLSLRISSATLQDSGRYYCRVELPDQPHANYENKVGTRLRVEAPSRILSVSVEGSVDTHLKALCRVQGSPIPDVQWMDLDEVLDADNGPLLLQGGPDQHKITSQLLDVQPGGQYTCTASNPLGKDQATLYVLPLKPEKSTWKNHSLTLPLMLGAALAVKTLLFMGLGAWLIKSSVKPWT